MIEFLLGIALIVAIVTMIGHFWHIWRPIFIGAKQVCWVLLQIAFLGAVGYGAIRLGGYLWKNAWLIWIYGTDFAAKNSGSIFQAFGVVLLVLVCMRCNRSMMGTRD